MRKKIIWITIFLGVAFNSYMITKSLSKPVVVPKEIEFLPAFNLLLTDSQTVINTAKAEREKSTVLFYFDPNCDHCQKQTEEILSNREILTEANYYFISIDSIKKIKQFEEYYQLRNFRQIIVAKDYKYHGFKLFKLQSIPTNIVYNKSHKIVKIFQGGMSISDLKKVLKT